MTACCGRAMLDLHPAQGGGATPWSSTMNITWKSGRGSGSLHPQFLHQLLEGQVLVLVRTERRLAHPVQELAERRVSRDVGRSASVLTKKPISPSISGAYAPRWAFPPRRPPPPTTGRAGGPGRRGAPCRAWLLRAGKPPQPLRHFAAAGSGKRSRRAPRRRPPQAVGGHLQHCGRSLQVLPPPGEQPLEHVPGEPLPLPRREVRVLHHRLLQRRRLASEYAS